MRTELLHPLLAKAISEDQYEYRTTGTTTEFKSPKIAIRRQLPEGSRIHSPISRDGGGAGNINMKPFYWECFTHSLIMIYGVAILVVTFYNPFQP